MCAESVRPGEGCKGDECKRGAELGWACSESGLLPVPEYPPCAVGVRVYGLGVTIVRCNTGGLIATTGGRAMPAPGGVLIRKV